MRFLKNKIKFAQEALQRKQEKLQSLKNIKEQNASDLKASRTKRSCSSYPELILASTFTRPVKNLIINYGKAIFSFAMSDLAKEYIDRYFQKEALDLPAFHQFLLEIKPTITGYDKFEAMFIVKETDSEQIALFRKALKVLGEVFIKYFSVNWIMHGKVAHKMVYLKHRHLVLRRIVKPRLSA